MPLIPWLDPQPRPPAPPAQTYIASMVCETCGANVYGHSPAEFSDAIKNHACKERRWR